MALARRRVAAVVVWLCVGTSSAFAQPCLYWSQDFVPGPPARRDHAVGLLSTGPAAKLARCFRPGIRVARASSVS